MAMKCVTMEEYLTKRHKFKTNSGRERACRGNHGLGCRPEWTILNTAANASSHFLVLS